MSAFETRWASRITASLPIVAPTQTTRGASREGKAPTPSRVRSKDSSGATTSRNTAAIELPRSSATSPRNRRVRWTGGRAESFSPADDGGSLTSTATNARTGSRRSVRTYGFGNTVWQKGPDLGATPGDLSAVQGSAHPAGSYRVPDDEQDECPSSGGLRAPVPDPLRPEGARHLGLDVDVPTTKEPPRPSSPGAVNGPGQLLGNGRAGRRRKLAEPRVGQRRVEPSLAEDLQSASLAREDPEGPQEQTSMLRALSARQGRGPETEPSGPRGREVAAAPAPTEPVPRLEGPPPVGEEGRVHGRAGQGERRADHVVLPQGRPRLLRGEHGEEQPFHHRVVRGPRRSVVFPRAILPAGPFDRGRPPDLAR